MGIPRPKSGQIKASYGKLRDQPEDIIVAWGDGVSRADRACVLHAMSELGKEMASRGFDVRSLRFSITKNRTPDETFRCRRA